jgi:hypothetical protein
MHAMQDQMISGLETETTNQAQSVAKYDVTILALRTQHVRFGAIDPTSNEAHGRARFLHSTTTSFITDRRLSTTTT